MCFGGSVPAPVAPAAAPPAPAPLAQAVSPTYGINAATDGQPGYNADGTPKLLRDGSVPTPGTGAGVSSTGASGLNAM